jgi:hypothetical protein
MTASPPAAPAATTTRAADPSAPKTREQVRAEVMQAQKDGSINDFNGDLSKVPSR